MNDLSTIFDQPVNVSPDTVFKTIDDIVQHAVATRDGELVIEMILDIKKVNQLSGLGLAWALYKSYLYWHNFDIGDDFVDTVEARTGISKDTITYAVEICQLIESTPDEYVDRIKSKNIMSLRRAAKAYAQGYDIEDEQWEKLADAPDDNTFIKIVRDEIKSEEPRTSLLQVFLERDGTINAWTKEGSGYVGYLDLESDDPIVQKAVKRIIGNARLIVR